MKSTLLKKVERFRFLAILLVMLCAYASAYAQLSSDEISEAVLVEGSLPVKWTNDAAHPWILGATNGTNELKTPETVEDSAFTSTVSFTYTSQYPTEVTFGWYRRTNGNDDILILTIDGEQNATTRSSSWLNVKLRLPEGNHTFELTSVSTKANYNNAEYHSAIRNLKILELKKLESACLKEGSLPLTFNNEEDLTKMWATEEGYIRSTDTSNSTAISTTFTIDKPSVFAFEYRNLQNNVYDSSCEIYIDDIWYTSIGSSTWGSYSIVLYPGNHIVKFENLIRKNSNTNCVSEVRNVRLDQTWYDITLNSPGELGTRMTQALEGKPIQDLELLKINGAMNSDDWQAVKLLTGIKAVDFTDAAITDIPENAFSGKSGLSTVMFPVTLKSIGNSAFKGTQCYRITIPAAVESIGNEVWTGTPLRYFTIADNSQLKSIGHSAFSKTGITEFYMPDSVETLETKSTSYYNSVYNADRSVYASHLFDGCTSLVKLHLSEALKNVAPFIANGCSSLVEVNLPKNSTFIGVNAFFGTKITSVDIPESVTSIDHGVFAASSLESVAIPKNLTDLGGYAFRNCKNLKFVYLNSHCWNMSNPFEGCTALEKVVLPCATPPTRYYNGKSYLDPFSGVDKTNVKLIVPDFAFDTYRTDAYWYQFTNTVKEDEASINDYWALRGNLHLNGSLVMHGNPSVEMMQGSRLTLDANSAQNFNEFTYHTSESVPTIVYSQSNSVKANRLVSKFFVNTKDKWFFFSPVTDVKMSEVSYPSTDSWVIRYYDGARRASENSSSGNWVNVPLDGTLKAGQGYIIQARATGWLYLPAAFTDEHDKFFGANEVSFELADNACETEANAGWNFVANPYPTYYDIYYIDMQAPITVWTGSTYKAYSLNDGDRGDDTFVLRPMQPFFVQKNAAGLTTGMPLVGRQTGTTIDRTRAPRPTVVDENRHKLNLELFCGDKESADDYTRVVLNEEATMAYETVRDASKFMTMNADVAQLYTLGADGHPMAINERPYEDGNVALGVLLPSTDRSYRIAACRADRKAWLYDAETGIEQDLTEGDYVFTASKTGVDNKRFAIRFAPATNAVEGVDAGAVKVIGNLGSISVSAPAGSAVAIYGTDGSVIANVVADCQLEIAVAAGVYVVKVEGESFKTIVK